MADFSVIKFVDLTSTGEKGEQTPDIVVLAQEETETDTHAAPKPARYRFGGGDEEKESREK